MKHSTSRRARGLLRIVYASISLTLLVACDSTAAILFGATLIIENNVHTSVNVQLFGPNQDYRTIPPLGDTKWDFTSQPGTVRFEAETYVRSTSGAVLGDRLTWSTTVNLTERRLAVTSLNTNPDVVLLQVRNTSTERLVGFEIVEVSGHVRDLNVGVAPDGRLYSVGYFPLVRTVRARYADSLQQIEWSNLRYSDELNQRQVLDSSNATALTSALQGQ